MNTDDFIIGTQAVCVVFTNLLCATNLLKHNKSIRNDSVSNVLQLTN